MYYRKNILFLSCTFGGFIEGVVTKIESKDYYVRADKKIIRCNLPGRFQKEFNLKKDKLYTLDIAVVGDKVNFEMNKDNTGTINNIAGRVNYISRKAPRMKGAGERGERLEQTLAANIDEVYIIASAINPSFNNRFIDRLIVAGESAYINVNVVINKMDLAPEEDVQYFKNIYSKLGYNVYITSIYRSESIDRLRNNVIGKKSLFFGQSGVGKSSILNGLFPTLDLKTGDVSLSTNKGKHTTVTSIMHGVGDNTFVIDTPGIREFDPYGVKKEDLGRYFKEFPEYINDCKFNNCTHFHEPGCAVRKAVETGKITSERYKSYLNILETIEEGLFF